MKIAAFVTDFPLHLLCWLCDVINGLAARGVQIDLFLYKAGEPPRFHPNIRAINLSQVARQIGTSGQSSTAHPEPLSFSTIFAPGVVETVERAALQARYDTCISFESRALILARIAAKAAGCSLVHHSFELYEPSYPGVWQDEFGVIKQFERKLIKDVDLFLIQDVDRQREYFRLLGTSDRPARTQFLPVALPRLSSTVKPRTWHQKYNLSPNTRVIFYMGQLSAARFVDQMIRAAQSFRSDQQIIVHGPIYNNTAAFSKLKELDVARRVIFSTEMLPWDQVNRLCASADIGLVFYRSQYINEITTGRSSDKLARYLQSGIPVVCSDFPSFRRETDKYHFGLCCSDFAQLPDLVNRICDDYVQYQEGARKAFDDVYNLDSYLDELVPMMKRLRQYRETISTIGSLSSSRETKERSAMAMREGTCSGEETNQKTGSVRLSQILNGDGNLFRYTKHVYLELSNLCNYAHLHKSCPVAHLAQSKDILSSRIVTDVLDTLGRYGYTGRIGFHTYNEPLMDPRLTRFIAHARKACPTGEIYICTNGYYLDQIMAEELVETGVSHIHVSAYSDSEQKRLETIHVSIPYHVERMTLDKRMDAYDSPETEDHRPCFSPLYQIVVTAAGRISLCCMDWKRQYCFGDLHKQSFEEAMKDPAMWSVYEKLSRGNRCFDLCRRCRFVRGQAGDEEIDMKKISSCENVNTKKQSNQLESPKPLTMQPVFGLRIIPSYDLSDPNRALSLARQNAEQGLYNESFDLYEQLSIAFPNQAVEILAEAYDQYRKIQNPDRYQLYQSRFYEFGIRPGDKVLDIGSGNVPFHLATHLADLTLDNDQYGRAGVPFKQVNGKPVYQYNIERLPFADKEFDFVYCSHVLEHVDNPAKACEELMRIAKRGYIETPSPAKDLWLDTIAISNHRWAVENFGGKLRFTEYSPVQRRGLQNSILREMHCNPQTPREKAFAALVYLKADRMNTMLLWDGRFEYEVRHVSNTVQISIPKIDNPKLPPQNLSGVGSSIQVSPGSVDTTSSCSLSIIVTVYQKEEYIGLVIAGIIENTTSPFELVMVYDGCTDRSEEVVNAVLAVNKGLMQKLTVVHTPDVNEVRANNAGMRAASGRYFILMQDDMQILERGWEKRLLYPILKWNDVFAVSSGKAHSFCCSPPPNPGVDYTSTAEAQRDVFQIRDAVNRGPLALRADTMKRLNYFDETYAPIYFDDMDLGVRAWRTLRMVCGVYQIRFRNLPRTVGANTQAKLSTGGTWLDSCGKNRRIFWERYHDAFSGRNHDEDRPCVFLEPSESQILPQKTNSQKPTIPVVKGLPLCRLGSEYGGWTIDLDLVPIGSTILSAGVGEDISFDLDLITRRNCMVIGIDPTEKAARYICQHSHPRYQFLQRALAEKGRSAIRMYKSANPDYVSESIDAAHKTVAPDQFYEAQAVCLDDLLRQFPDVSLLKMDVEGAEYSALAAVQRLEIPQICVEFHHFCTNHTVEDTLGCMEALGRMGYVVAHATGKAAPLQQVTFIHSKYLPKMPVQQSSGVNSMCSCV